MDRENAPPPAPPPTPPAADQVGRFLDDMGAVTERIVRRNLSLWNGMSQSLRQDRYTADAMAADAARTMSAAVDNLNDVWSLWARVPGQGAAAGVATAFLFFARRDDEARTHTPPDPVAIRVPFEDVDDLPEQAQIALSGVDERGVLALQACLSARLQTGRAYLLEPHDVGGLIPGVYNGAVYIDEPARPLATLEVVVQGPAPGGEAHGRGAEVS
jgi:hypothetical protein